MATPRLTVALLMVAQVAAQGDFGGGDLDPSLIYFADPEMMNSTSELENSMLDNNTTNTNATTTTTTTSSPLPAFCPETTVEYSNKPIYMKITLPGGKSAGSTHALEKGSAGRQVDNTCVALEWDALTFACEPTTMEWTMTNGAVQSTVPVFCDKWETGYGYVTNTNDESILKVVDTTFPLTSCKRLQDAYSIGALSVTFDLPTSQAHGEVVSFEEGMVETKINDGTCNEISWTDHSLKCDVFDGTWNKMFGSVSMVESKVSGCTSTNGTMIENGDQPLLVIEELKPTSAPTQQPQVQLPSASPGDLTTIPVPETNSTELLPAANTTITSTESPIVTTAAPTAAPISAAPTTVVYCGCVGCDQSAMDNMASTFTCGDLITYMMSLGQPESVACRSVARDQYPATCGACNPETCVASEIRDATDLNSVEPSKSTLIGVVVSSTSNTNATNANATVSQSTPLDDAIPSNGIGMDIASDSTGSSGTTGSSVFTGSSGSASTGSIDSDDEKTKKPHAPHAPHAQTPGILYPAYPAYPTPTAAPSLRATTSGPADVSLVAESDTEDSISKSISAGTQSLLVSFPCLFTAFSLSLLTLW